MKNRPLAAVGSLILVLAACSPAVSDTTSTTGNFETTTSEQTASEAAVLAYSLADGESVSYQVGINQHLEMNADGDADAMGEELPGEAVIDITGSATFTHEVSEGSEPGTYEVHVTGEFDDLSVTGTVDGEPVDEVPEFAGLEPIDVTFLIDDKGNVIVDGEMIEDPFGGALGDFGSLGSGMAPGMDPGQFVGPMLPEGEVMVGDSWTNETEIPLFGDAPVVTSVTSTVSGTDRVDGHDVFVIDTVSATSPIEINLGEMLIGMFTAFLPEDPTAEEQAQIDAMLEGLQFIISINDARSNATTLFDVSEGVARQSDVDASLTMLMDINIPDETTGEMIAFSMTMTMSQQITYELLGSSGA